MSPPLVSQQIVETQSLLRVDSRLHKGPLKILSRTSHPVPETCIPMNLLRLPLNPPPPTRIYNHTYRPKHKKQHTDRTPNNIIVLPNNLNAIPKPP